MSNRAVVIAAVVSLLVCGSIPAYVGYKCGYHDGYDIAAKEVVDSLNVRMDELQATVDSVEQLRQRILEYRESLARSFAYPDWESFAKMIERIRCDDTTFNRLRHEGNFY